MEAEVGDVPVRFFHYDFAIGLSDFQLHWHEEIEIHMITGGCGSFFVDGREYPVQTGDIVFISPRVIHNEESECNNLKGIYCVIDRDYLISKNSGYSSDTFFSELDGTKITSPVIRPQDYGYAAIAASLRSIEACSEKEGTVYQLEIKRNLYDFFIGLYHGGYLSDAGNTEFSTETEKIIKKSIRYIQKNASSRLTIERIASHVGLSSSYFMKLFRETTKMTCIEYVRLLRLNNSATLLRETDESILQVAQSCGFHNLSLFNREFKKHFSITPSNYRKKYRNTETG